MKRRDFIRLAGAAAVCPVAARAQQPQKPVVGFLSSQSPDTYSPFPAAFREGLKEQGFSDGENVTAAFTAMAEQKVGAMMVGVGAFLINQRAQIIAFAAQHAIPCIYSDPASSAVGGLMSYGNVLSDSYRRNGVYVGRILKGDKPGDLPIDRATKFELVINLKTAKALGLDIPPTLLALADEVIE